MRRLPLSDRKAELRKLLGKTNGGLQFVAHAEIEGEEAFATACEAGLEGASLEAADGALPSRARASRGSRSEIRNRRPICGSSTTASNRSTFDELHVEAHSCQSGLPLRQAKRLGLLIDRVGRPFHPGGNAPDSERLSPEMPQFLVVFSRPFADK